MREHIVILGGGFAGWYAARALAPRLRAGHRITLIDRVDHMLYTPMLTEVAGGTLPSRSIAVPMEQLPKRVRVLKSEIQTVDARAKAVTLTTGEVVHATQLVFALGSRTAYHGVPGAEEHSIPLKTLADAKNVLARVDALVKEATTCQDEMRRRQLLTVVVAGGGYTGVETIASVAEHLGTRARAAGLAEKEVSAILIEPTERLMRETPASLAAYSQQRLEQQGIRVVLKVGVQSVAEASVTLTSGETITTGLLIWDAGIEPNPLLKNAGLPLSKHDAAIVDACFCVQDLDGVWAIGDCAEIPQAAGGFYGATAQNATREGVHLAQNISAVIRGDAPRPFRFTMLGQLALLADGKAVAEILGVKIHGTVAWLLWWAIYIAKLPWWPGRALVLQQAMRRSERL